MAEGEGGGLPATRIGWVMAHKHTVTVPSHQTFSKCWNLLFSTLMTKSLASTLVALSHQSTVPEHAKPSAGPVTISKHQRDPQYRKLGDFNVRSSSPVSNY